MLRTAVKILLVFCISLVTPAYAHHGASTKFDTQRSVAVTGLISRIDWAFPHAHLFIMVTSNNVTQPWYIELESPQLLELNGWTETTAAVGDVIEVSGFPARDGSRQLWGENISVTGSSNRLFTTDTSPNLLSSITSAPDEATPRWPDGTPRLSAAPGRSGYWVPTTTVLQEDGANIAMLPNGQLDSLADAAKVAPLQDWALKLYTLRQRNFLQSDPTYIECRPPAGPRKFLNPYGIQLLEDKPLDRVFVIAGGGNHDFHLLYTDGRALDSEDFYLDAGNLLYYGRNTAHWEGDTFVIESEGYNEKFWLPGGLPHSELLKATEKLTRTSYNTMTYQITLNDPGTYTRPWTASWDFQWLEGQDPPEHYCQDNRL